ncbi:MAG: SAVED domain-containing protein [Calditrichaeota bacterium]|nr:MAG: SAVED domain-containing protein [Calditrichota bacterium]
MRDFIMTWLDPISVVVGLIVSIPIFWTWWEVTLGRKRRHKAWYENARKGKSVDAVLIVDLLAGADMKPEVLRHLKQQGVEVEDSHVFEMNEHGEVTPENLPDLVARLRALLADVSRLAPGELHVFFGGPSGFAMLVGAELANKGNVHIYQRTHGKYQDWGPIRHAYF